MKNWYGIYNADFINTSVYNFSVIIEQGFGVFLMKQRRWRQGKFVFVLN
jgi:hypothetical protein